MKPSFSSHSCFVRERFPIVYVNRFGSHRCGTVIEYGGRGHLRHREKGTMADSRFCLVDEAVSTISDRTGSEGAAHSSSVGGRSPCFMLGASSRVGAKGAEVCRSQPLNKEGAAERVKARKIVTKLSSLNKHRIRKNVATRSTSFSTQKQIGGHQEMQGDIFEFPSPLENNNVIRQQQKKSAVWFGVSKVISQMVEENEHFRNRLMCCSQLSSENSGVTQNGHNGASCIDKDEAIFGWV